MSPSTCARTISRNIYNGFANRVLWPILHYRLDLAEFSRRDLSAAISASTSISPTHLEKLLKPDDMVWVHDYHLIPLAKALRDRGLTESIGFFLHIPLPPPEIITALPNHERLIPALCHYDLVGLPDRNRRQQFRPLSGRRTGHAGAYLAAAASGDRVCAVGIFPVGDRDRPFRPSGAARDRSELCARCAARACPARHDHRRRPAGLFQRHP